MKVKIERIHYASLRNDEFPVVYEQTVSICEKHRVESLHLEKTFSELVSFRPALESLTVHLRKNEKLARSGKNDFSKPTGNMKSCSANTSAKKAKNNTSISPSCEIIATKRWYNS